MPYVCCYFQVHQPERLRTFRAEQTAKVRQDRLP